jgi:hypothetical protein
MYGITDSIEKFVPVLYCPSDDEWKKQKRNGCTFNVQSVQYQYRE